MPLLFDAARRIDDDESLMPNHLGHTKQQHTKENTMKTENVGFWLICALTASVLAAPAAHSQMERFSASLSGANEVTSN